MNPSQLHPLTFDFQNVDKWDVVAYKVRTNRPEIAYPYITKGLKLYSEKDNLCSLFSKTTSDRNEMEVSFESVLDLPDDPLEDEDLSLEIRKRIGSESMEAEVYLISLVFNNFEYNVAAKILIESSDFDRAKNQNEIKIAKLASDLVINGLSHHFLLVYGDTQCDRILLDQKSKLLEPCTKYQLEKQLTLQFLKPQIKRFFIQHKLVNEVDLINSAESTFKGFKYQNTGCRGSILFSELAWGDVTNFFQKDICFANDKLTAYIIKDTFNAINDLQIHLRVVHNDLHTGNLLIRGIKDETNHLYPEVVIHDFGKSELKDQLVGDDWSTDFEKFIGGIANVYCLSLNIKQKIERLIMYSKQIEKNNHFMQKIQDQWSILCRDIFSSNNVSEYRDRLERLERLERQQKGLFF